MEGIRKGSSGDVAPFVAKTYNMVCEPRTDAIIRWGRGNNSFIVLDLSRFSQILLPSYFKHNNFSSFIRQLNTYGFRKVDPDHWEFAHECFLRGQIHLLPLILRRKKKGCRGGGGKDEHLEDEEDGEERLLEEVARLRIEQKAIREEMDDMSKRLLATERKPRQMVSFLIKVAQDPELLPRLVLSKKEQRKQQQQQLLQQVAGLDEKTSWLCADNSSSSSSLPPLPQSLQEFHQICEMAPNEGLRDTAISSDSELSSIPSTEQYHVGAPCSQIFILPEFVDHEEAEECVAYPFSLLGHILF